METAADQSPFEFSGGALCLDFVNTLGDRPRSEDERLHGYDDLLRWAGEAGVLDRSARSGLARRAARRSGEAASAFRRAIALRESLFGVFAALAEGRDASRAELEALNRRLHPLLSRRKLAAGEETLRWIWSGPATAWDRPLWQVAASAAELLTSCEVPQLRECASETCSWLFVDRSRSHRRRWCDMKTCGNRAKARRHYRRSKRSQTAD
ncbi:MAG: CGNR zinc finger domain-containing protein [Acidobacteriota bacterium]|jgi:predicted RNA-binding Zn ribbon-like protein